jgi:acyl-CoA dehydrogenase
MDFGLDSRTEELQNELLDFMRTHVYPAEAVFDEQLEEAENRWAWDSAPVMVELRAEARRRGLWNLFLPGDEGAGLTNVQYAVLAEISGRSPHLAPAAMNCAAPDTGNMELLSMCANQEQKERWLMPLLAGEIRSSFAMTEPSVASSDATNIATSIVRDGDHYVINGRKWWITGAMNPNAKIFIVMGKTDPDAERHRQQSMILVERDTPGFGIHRGLTVLGYDDHQHGGHAELSFDDVRVPAGNLVGNEGDGFTIAQKRLGPGRIHHCMRSVGVAERAIELMCARADDRVAFGKPLSEQGTVRDWIAEARVRVEQLRLLVLPASRAPTPRSKPSRWPPRPRSSGSSTRRSRSMGPVACRRTSPSLRCSPRFGRSDSPTGRTRSTRTGSPGQSSAARRPRGSSSARTARRR